MRAWQNVELMNVSLLLIRLRRTAMEAGVRDGGAFDETVDFLRCFEGLAVPRQPGKVIYSAR